MTSHERFAAACTHRPPDRPPVDYLAHPEADRKLLAALGVGTERELQHVRDTVTTLGSDGGYVFAPSQILGPDIPVDNIRAMYGV